MHFLAEASPRARKSGRCRDRAERPASRDTQDRCNAWTRTSGHRSCRPDIPYT